MTWRILVTYATRFGSTAEVAAKIDSVLSQAGAVVDLRPVDKVRSLEAYDAVIIGSPIRGGTWTAEAAAFLEAHRSELAQLPVAYFTVCMTLREDTPETRQLVSDYHTPLLASFPEIRPVSIGMFAGRVNYATFSWLVNLMAKASAIPEGDWRQWTQIEDWARALVPLLKPNAVGQLDQA